VAAAQKGIDKMIIRGRVHKYGDDVNTDVIIPARYLNVSRAEDLAAHCLEDLDPEFARKVRPGDIIVAGKNFGCGSSREHAPLAIKASGVAAVVAVSFARIFYRNAVNIGLPVFECPEIIKAQSGNDLEINPDEGKITNLTRGETYEFVPLPAFMREIYAAGGLIEYVKRKV